jgi:hypothetical protein
VNILLIGNLISGIGCLLMVLIGLLRKKSHILLAQSLQCVFMGAGHLVLGGTSGFIANMVSIVRNLVFLKFEATKGRRLFFILVQLLLSLGSLGGGLICWIPIFNTALFTWSLDIKNEIRLKAVILFTQCLWFVYDLTYRNYVAMVFDLMAIIANGIGIAMIRKANA